MPEQDQQLPSDPAVPGRSAPIDSAPDEPRGLPAVRIGLLGGLTGILCCVGPTVLALFGVVSAATAFSWATNLYDNYTWWFRLAGLLVLVGLVIISLRRRNQCTLSGVRRNRTKLLLVGAVAVGTYVGLYAVTTLLGNVAS